MPALIVWISHTYPSHLTSYWHTGPSEVETWWQAWVERADMHHNFIGEVERGNMECSLTSMVRIAKALGVRVKDLLRRV